MKLSHWFVERLRGLGKSMGMAVASGHHELSAEHAGRLAAIRRARTGASERSSDLARSARWVVADVETSGLDIYRDHLLAIGAVAVVGGDVQLMDSFEVVLKQTRASSDENILIHRIGGTEQMAGVEATEALLAFWEFVGDGPLVGYHAQFDAHMIERASHHYLGSTLRHAWLDLALLAPALRADSADDRGTRRRTGAHAHELDWWLRKYDVQVASRHNAAADALGTAQLFSALLGQVDARASVESLSTLAKDYAWHQQQPTW